VSCSVKQLKYELSHDGNMDEIKGSFDQWTRRRGFPRPVQHPASLAHSPWACSVDGGGGGGGAPPPPPPPPPRVRFPLNLKGVGNMGCSDLHRAPMAWSVVLGLWLVL
jgi:hypothetical protein